MSARSTMMASALRQPRELPTSHRSGRAIMTKGTLTVQGLTPGTALVLSGEWTDSFFNTIAIPATDVAVVATTEPGTAGLLALGSAASSPPVGGDQRRKDRRAQPPRLGS